MSQVKWDVRNCNALRPHGKTTQVLKSESVFIFTRKRGLKREYKAAFRHSARSLLNFTEKKLKRASLALWHTPFNVKSHFLAIQRTKFRVSSSHFNSWKSEFSNAEINFHLKLVYTQKTSSYRQSRFVTSPFLCLKRTKGSNN